MDTRKADRRFSYIVAALTALAALGGVWAYGQTARLPRADPHTHFAVVKTDAQWRKVLTPEQYSVLRQQGTEAPYSGKYNDFWQPGVYRCAACGNPLFSAKTKYDPHEGWPSFWAPLSKGAVLVRRDDSLGMERTEVICARCGGHLGHVFDDGPRPTGLRYCIDSAALTFVPDKGKKQ